MPSWAVKNCVEPSWAVKDAQLGCERCPVGLRKMPSWAVKGAQLGCEQLIGAQLGCEQLHE